MKYTLTLLIFFLAFSSFHIANMPYRRSTGFLFPLPFLTYRRLRPTKHLQPSFEQSISHSLHFASKNVFFFQLRACSSVTRATNKTSAAFVRRRLRLFSQTVDLQVLHVPCRSKPNDCFIALNYLLCICITFMKYTLTLLIFFLAFSSFHIANMPYRRSTGFLFPLPFLTYRRLRPTKHLQPSFEQSISHSLHFASKMCSFSSLEPAHRSR